MIRAPQKIRMIKTNEIIPNPYQARRKFSEKELERLSCSLKEVGMLSPIIVRGTTAGYELVCGQRRVRAALMAGMEAVPAIVIRAGDLQCAQLSIIENLHRVNLSCNEEAEGYFNLMAYHRVKKEKLIKILSAEKCRINEKVRLLALDEDVRYKIEENRISEKTARELLKLHDRDKQLEILNLIIKEELSHQSVCHMVKQALRDMAQKKRETEKKKSIKITNMPLCVNTVKKTVEILKNSGAKVEMTQTDSENYIEFIIKTYK